MPKSLIAAAILSLLAASPAFGKPPSRAAEVAKAKASIEEMADEVAIEIWQKRSASMDKNQLSMDLHRSVGRWLAAGFSIGMCENYAKTTMVADWLGKIDGLSRALGGDFTLARREYELTGMRLRTQGQGYSLGPRSCDIELEAVRQILATL